MLRYCLQQTLETVVTLVYPEAPPPPPSSTESSLISTGGCSTCTPWYILGRYSDSCQFVERLYLLSPLTAPLSPHHPPVATLCPLREFVATPYTTLVPGVGSAVCVSGFDFVFLPHNLLSPRSSFATLCSFRELLQTPTPAFVPGNRVRSCISGLTLSSCCTTYFPLYPWEHSPLTSPSLRAQTLVTTSASD